MLGQVQIINGVKQIIPVTDTTPIDEVTVNNVQSVTSNAVAQSKSYSTTETKTGGVWTDGKPIYRKVFTGLNFGDVIGTWTNTGASLSNVNYLINGKAVRKTSSQITVVNSFNYQMSGNNIQYHAPANPYGSSSILIIEYTKTTD